MKKHTVTVAEMLRREKIKQQWLKKMKANCLRFSYLVLMAILNDAEQKAKELDEKKKKMTEEERAAITAETKALRTSLLSVPPPPFQKISPAPGISHLNALDLYVYVNIRYVKILALPEMATCSPTVAYVQAISDALYPYAIQNGRKMIDADLNTRDTLTTQCKEQFTLLAQSCALLANGNKSLFLLTEIACKRKGTPRTIGTTPPDFRIETNRGAGRLGIVITAVENAENYTVFYGVGDYDKATWDSITGGLRQVIEDQTPGKNLNIIVRANGTHGTATDNSSPQGRNVPFN